MRERTPANFARFTSTAGARFAYAHHSWAAAGSGEPIRVFWKRELRGTGWDESTLASILGTVEYVASQRGKWLAESLRYLPRGHVFDSTVYLLPAYDNIVYGHDVGLNLTFGQFRADRREAVYYLIHELAHAGYLTYHRMPDLAHLKTGKQLLSAVKLLTQLEGMGVASAYRLRMDEGGLLDNDYLVLLDKEERETRVHRYFSTLSDLSARQGQKLGRHDVSRTLDQFSSRPDRLWYIAGAHIALSIEQSSGVDTLSALVKEGYEAFFRAYNRTVDPLRPG